MPKHEYNFRDRKINNQDLGDKLSEPAKKQKKRNKININIDEKINEGITVNEMFTASQIMPRNIANPEEIRLAETQFFKDPTQNVLNLRASNDSFFEKTQKFFRDEGDQLEKFDPTQAKYDYRFSNSQFSKNEPSINISQDVPNISMGNMPE